MSDLSVQLSFNPATTPQATVIAAIHRLYGEPVPASVIALADNPAIGADADEPGTTAAATVAADGTVQFDSTGLPWDDRIHSTPAKLTAAKVWRKGRNVTDATMAAVTAELKAKYPAGNTVPATAGATPAVAGGLPALGGPGALPGLTAPLQAGPTPFQEFAAWLGARMTTPANPTGRISAEWLKNSLLAYQVADGELQNLASAPAESIAAIKLAIATALGETV